MEGQTFIVALLSYVKPIGYVVLPYSCYRENEKFISVHERLSKLNISNYSNLTEAEAEVFKLAESYSNQSLIILLQNNIPFYNGKGGSNLYAEDKITIEREYTQASLKFVRTEEGTRYKLRAFHAENEIILQNPENVILVNEPCWYLAGSKLVRFNEQITGKLLIPFSKKDSVIIPKHIEYQYFSTFIRKIANRCDIEAEGFQIKDLHFEPEAILSLETGCAVSISEIAEPETA